MTRAGGGHAAGARERARTTEATTAAPGGAPGDGLLELVAMVGRLRGPGGCPWDADQTHESLVQYLVEECWELIDAIESGSREEMIEELGDVLYQVLFHADLAAHTPGEDYDIDDVARHMTAKMVARHPHVFGDREAETAADVVAFWDDPAEIMPVSHSFSSFLDRSINDERARWACVHQKVARRIGHSCTRPRNARGNEGKRFCVPWSRADDYPVCRAASSRRSYRSSCPPLVPRCRPSAGDDARKYPRRLKSVNDGKVKALLLTWR
jgi:NTP pyrophosphatase (non-canonical NTP hydrolase)